MKIFLIHGSRGNSKENWFPWITTELTKLGPEVIAPDFPNPPDQSLQNWMKEFKPYLETIDSNTIFVAHSLGPAFVLSILESVPSKVKACFFVAGFTGALNLPKFDPVNKTFTEKEFNWKKIISNCEKFILFASDNDPYVPLSKTQELCDKLNGKLIIVPNGGHFGTKAGYTEFARLLEEIKKIN
ncbi:MAG: alpha/beta hydrolase [archaeon]|jgi:hypothetical protein